MAVVQLVLLVNKLLVFNAQPTAMVISSARYGSGALVLLVSNFLSSFLSRSLADC